MEFRVSKYRNYWVYSIACFVVWSVLLGVVAAKGDKNRTQDVLLVFGGWCIAWISTTIARFVYPPPRRWLQPKSPQTLKLRSTPDSHTCGYEASPTQGEPGGDDDLL